MPSRPPQKDAAPDSSVAVKAIVAQRIRARVDEIADAMCAAYRREIEEYAQLRDAELLREVRDTTASNVLLLSHVIEVGKPLDDTALELLAGLGRRRAMQGFPLYAILRAYQVGVSVAWEFVTEEVDALALPPELAAATVMETSESILRLTSQISCAIVDVYLSQEREEGRSEERARHGLFGDLLRGGNPDEEAVRERAARLGFQLGERHIVCKVTLEPASDQGPRFDSLAARAHQLAGRLARVSVDGRPPLLDVEGKEICVIWTIAEDRQVGRLRDAIALALDGYRAAEPLRVLAALGAVEPGVRGIAVSHEQARAALSAMVATEPTSRVVLYEDLIPTVLLLEHPQRAQALWRTAMGPLQDHDRRQGTRLVETVCALIEANGNVSAASRRLNVHRHTLERRVEQIKTFTGRDPADSDDLRFLSLALLANRVLQH